MMTESGRRMHDIPPTETTVVVAMSGGVDSSVAAALLTERGYRCIGVMMRLWAEVASGEGSGNKCCDEESVEDARRVAAKLGMPFYLINVERPFKEKVVDLFIKGYGDGLTPNPCLACNRHIRFDYLLNYARRLGAGYLATGHYARLRRQADGNVHLLRGVDVHKDQSYVLSVLGQAELRDLLFPVGDFAKEEVRRMAAARGLPIHSKHDSMDLCFVVDDDYRRFLTDWAADAMTAGEIVDVEGNVLGRHSGLPNYTVGQRRGLGLSGATAPMYVVALEPDSNRLVVGPAEALGRSELLATGVNWTMGRPVSAGSRVQCQIRYSGQPLDCTLYPQQDGSVRVAFTEPARGISPGQAAVFYDGPHCLGGGLIDKMDPGGVSAASENAPAGRVSLN
ncbi:MAG: tRNA 2-thiouridine(34) synthase MnmA [Caldilineaceae bacterium]|nr:tRNA 2-thiouridine(34) synthase MnmA [Caldilineaceae bacterium]